MVIVKFGRAWVSPQFSPTAIKVALVVGTILIMLNHGLAIAQGAMTTERWFSAVLTYIVPYTVSIHGQYVAHSKTTATDVD